MVNASGLSFAQFEPKSLFQESYRKFLAGTPGIANAMEAFVGCKIHRPPKPLPGGMRDHHLTGDLAGFRECHLAGDVLLIYTDKGNVVSPLLVCRHDALYGPRGRALKKTLADLTR